MNLTNIPDPGYLGLAISPIQGNMGLKNMSDPTCLNLTNIQTQDNMSLTNVPDPRHAKPQGNSEHVRVKTLGFDN